MSGDFEKLKAAVRDFQANADLDFVDPKELSSLVDSLQGTLCTVLNQAKMRGANLLTGQTPCSWAAQTCGLTPNAASDRLCVGRQLEAMPRVAEALASGEIGYQATSVICHFRDLLREDLRELCYEEQWIGHAKEYTVKNLHWLAEHVRYMLDPDSFDHGIEEDYEKRFLSISESSGMFHISGVLDREGGSALKTAIESLSKRIGTGDERTPKQRRADALVMVAHHAMNQGTLPRRNGVRPHVTVHTTIEGLKRELGAAASELQKRDAGLEQDGAAAGLRWRSRPGPQSRIPGGRCRPGDAGRFASAVAGPQSAAPDLRGAGMRPAHQLDQPASHRVLGPRREDQPARPASPLLLPPPSGTRRRMAAGTGWRQSELHSARKAGAHPAEMGRGALGGLIRPMQYRLDPVLRHQPSSEPHLLRRRLEAHRFRPTCDRQ